MSEQRSHMVKPGQFSFTATAYTDELQGGGQGVIRHTLSTQQR